MIDFESQTYAKILAEQLQRISNTVDKREGSLIQTALGPEAYTFEELYMCLSKIQQNAYTETAVAEYLDLKAAELGIQRKPATVAIREGIFDAEVPIGSRFSADEGANSIIFQVVEKISDGRYKLQAETVGEAGNAPRGTLIAIDYVANLTSAQLGELLIPAVDEESDDELRARCKAKFSNPVQDANIAQYLQWAEGFESIGTARVFPLWAGGNTVKVVITDRNNQPASAALIESFQQYMDPDSEGIGNGVAPIGAKVTITGGVRKDINISATVSLNDGYVDTNDVEQYVVDYIASIVFKKAIVSYMRVGSAILDAPSIADLSNLQLNGGTTDVALGDEEIPVLNALTLTIGA